MQNPEISGFEIHRLISRGASGRVYEAVESGLGRRVAVKVLSDPGDAEQYRRFEEEARVIAGLSHANIARVYAFLRTPDGAPCLIMEYLSGGTLAEVVRGRVMTPRTIAQLMITVANAVHAAHEAGVIHRDLKPGNILFARVPWTAGSTVSDAAVDAETASAFDETLNERKTAADPLDVSGSSRHRLVPGQEGDDSGFDCSAVRIVDFGIARRITSEVRLTRTGQFLGTPAYMAPEQASGITLKLSPAADVYSLGAVFYELLVGIPPFPGNDALDTVMRLLTEEPALPSLLKPDVPRDLQTICMKCLQKDPRRRYQSAQELSQELERYLNMQPILSRPAGHAEKTWKWARRNPWKATAAVLLTLIACGSLTAVFVIRSAYEETRTVNTQLINAVAETDSALQLSRDALDRIVVRVRDELYEVPQATPVMLATCRDAAELYRKLHLLRPEDPQLAEEFMNALESIGLAEWLFGSRDESSRIYAELEAFTDAQVRQHPDQSSFRVMQTKLLLDKIPVEEQSRPELRAHLKEQLQFLLSHYGTSPEVLKLAVQSCQHDMNTAVSSGDMDSLLQAARLRVEYAGRYRDCESAENRDEASLWHIRSLISLGNALVRHQMLAEAKSTYLNAGRELAAAGPNAVQRDVQNAKGDVALAIAKVAVAENDLKEAVTQLNSAITILESLLEDHPDDWLVRESLVRSMLELAEIPQQESRIADPENLLQRISEHIEQLKSSPAGSERFTALVSRLQSLNEKSSAKKGTSQTSANVLSPASGPVSGDSQTP